MTTPSTHTSRVGLYAFVALLGLVLVRAVIAADLFPWWGTDPTISPVANTSLTPAGILLINMLTLAAAGVVLLVVPSRSNPAVSIVQTLCFAAGMVAVGVNGYGLASDRLVDADDLALGSTWGVGLTAAVAVARACAGVVGGARFAVSAFAGGLAMIAVKAIVQLAVEIPQTVAMFKGNKGQFLAAHGWAEGSPMARAFEHRLLTADASGWFGMSNVLATLGVWGVFVGVGMLIAWRTRRATTGPELARDTAPKWLVIGVVLAAAAGAVCLWGGGSKGGYAATLVGFLVVGAAVGGRRVPALRPLLVAAPWLLFAAVVAGVFARGWLGERLGERSLLFRWYYLEACGRIIQDHIERSWLWGTGPGDFRDAYALFKNPLNPEEVSSPHNVLADFAATLGVGGVLWGLLWIMSFRPVGLALAEPPAPEPQEPADTPRPNWAFLRLALFGLVSAVAIWMDRPAGGPESALTRLIGLGAAMLAAHAAMEFPPSRLWLAAGACAAGMLGLIDLAPVSLGAGPWFFCLPALLAAGTAAAPIPQAALLGRLPALAMFAAIAALAPGFRAIRAWETGLRRSFDVIADLSLVRTTLRQVATGQLSPADPDAAEAMVRARELTRQPSSVPLPEVGRALDAAFMQAVDIAADTLRETASAFPSHWGTREAWSRLRLQQAELFDPKEHSESVALAVEDGLFAARPTPRDPSSAWAWAATARQAAATLGVKNDETSVASITAALHEAKKRDAHNLNLAWRLFELADANHDDLARGIWAAEVVRLSDLAKMDPSGARALVPEQVARAKAAVATPQPRDR